MQKIRPDTQIQQIGASLNQGLLWNGTGWAPVTVSLPGHTHVESDVTALVGDLAAKVAKSILTAKGSIITATGSAAPVELPVGTDGQVLSADSTQTSGLRWVTGGGGGMTDPTTTKGDLIVRSATAPTRLPVGTDGWVLVSRSTATNGVDWESTPASAFVGCKVYRSAALTLTVGGAGNSIVSWDTEEWDTNAFHDPATNPDRITIPTGQAGKYRVVFVLGTGTTIACNRFLAAVYKNGAATRGGNAEMSSTGSTYPCHSLAFDVDMAVGDYLNAQYYIDTGAAPAMHTVASCFSVQKIG